MQFHDCLFRLKSGIALLGLAALLTASGTAGELAGSTLRSERISLAGTWKFQLRQDNQLTANGVVKFGPLTASSQVLTKDPAPGENPLARFNLGLPWGLAATLAGPALARDPAQAIWKPHPKQPGPTWWQANLGSKQRIDAVRVNWAKPGEVKVAVDISLDGTDWSLWASGKSRPDEHDTTLQAPPADVQFVKLTFTPAQFEGTRKIEIRLRDSLGRLTLWQPPVRKTWYEDLRKYQPDGFQQVSYDDSTWPTIQVPGYWEAQGFGKPDWFEANGDVGYYRRTFTLPDSWRGRHVRMRFESANNGAQVWVNGHEVTYHEGGFTPFECDITPLVKFGAQNLVAVRVAKMTLTSEYETDDAFFLGGLWRHVYLYSLPADHIEDFWVQTDLDPVYRNAVLKVELKLRAGDPDDPRRCVVEGSLFDANGKPVPLEAFRTELTLSGLGLTSATLSAVVKNPRKWTAETPYLYSLLLRLKSQDRIIQEIRSPVGFRRVEVKGMRLLVNGVPIEIRGVVTVRANPNDSGEPPEKMFVREIRLLKEGNINAIRSHTTPLEEEFLDLCDRNGIYVLPDVPYVWVMEEDFRYLADDLVQRAKEIFDYHKNHPSVILWHVGNENHPTAADLGGGRASRWLSEHDPTRPVVVCRNPADFQELGTAITDLHYDPMTYPEFRELYPHPVIFGEFHAVPNEIRRLKDLGFVETWGRSLQREWTAFRDRYFYVVGGLLCCWEDGSLNGDLGYNQWGVVDSKHYAKPVHYYIRKSFAPIQVALQDVRASEEGVNATVKITNRYNFSDLDGFTFQWVLRNGERETASERVAYRVPPATSSYFPLSLSSPTEVDRIRITVHDADGYLILDEEFPLPIAAGPSSMSDLLSMLGIPKSPALPLAPHAEEVRTPTYRAQTGPDAQVRIQDSDGRDWIKLNGIAMQAEETEWTNLLSASVQYRPAEKQPSALAIPFTVSGGTKDKKQTWQMPGTLKAEFGDSWIQFSYTLEPEREVSIPEAGIRLQLASRLSHLSWNRTALWSTRPAGWRDGSLEQHVPLSALRETGSKRGVLWTTLESDEVVILLAPLGSATNLRTGSAPEEIVLSDFLSSGNFLGKFDKETAEKKLAAGEKFQGGFTLYFLTGDPRQRFLNFSDAEKDLTWGARAKALVAN